MPRRTRLQRASPRARIATGPDQQHHHHHHHHHHQTAASSPRPATGYSLQPPFELLVAELGEVEPHDLRDRLRRSQRIELRGPRLRPVDPLGKRRGALVMRQGYVESAAATNAAALASRCATKPTAAGTRDARSSCIGTRRPSARTVRYATMAERSSSPIGDASWTPHARTTLARNIARLDRGARHRGKNSSPLDIKRAFAARAARVEHILKSRFYLGEFEWVEKNYGKHEAAGWPDEVRRMRLRHHV